MDRKTFFQSLAAIFLSPSLLAKIKIPRKSYRLSFAVTRKMIEDAAPHPLAFSKLYELSDGEEIRYEDVPESSHLIVEKHSLPWEELEDIE